MFKKVYVEITNNCNLNCDFCIKNNRPNKFISIDEFNIVINKIKNHTKYIYMHILGEPLLHPNINELIDIAYKSNINVNITSNGYLINRIKENKNIRQINISLHSYDKRYNKTLDEYLKDILDTSDILTQNKTHVSLRLWVKSRYSKEILDYINNRYNTNIKLEDIKRNVTIKDYLYISTNEEFIWPDLNNNYYEETGKCYALRDHIGILVDGTVIPCCLDSKGIINLGNIYNSSLEEILNSERVNKMLEGFKNNKKCEELCKHCKYNMH